MGVSIFACNGSRMGQSVNQWVCVPLCACFRSRMGQRVNQTIFGQSVTLCSGHCTHVRSFMSREVARLDIVKITVPSGRGGVLNGFCVDIFRTCNSEEFLTAWGDFLMTRAGGSSHVDLFLRNMMNELRRRVLGVQMTSPVASVPV